MIIQTQRSQPNTIASFVKILRSNVQDVAAWLGLYRALDKDSDKLVCLQQVIRLQSQRLLVLENGAQRLQHRVIELEEERDKLIEEDLEIIDDLRQERIGKQNAENELAIARSTILKLNARVQKIQGSLDEQQRNEDYSQPSSQATSLLDTMQILLPNIEFLRSSLIMLSADVEYKAALRVLYELCHKPESVKGKSFESAEGWRERHFSNEGRIYFKKNLDGKFKVLLSRKQSQSGDERYLKKFG
ncbi:hypothetical protein HY772_08830 [Candidatus Woesearchaeota archaeon]|nr:hypothetical protein [Candidatus Woesearchaeota archaeon]